MIITKNKLGSRHWLLAVAIFLGMGTAPAQADTDSTDKSLHVSGTRETVTQSENISLTENGAVAIQVGGVENRLIIPHDKIINVSGKFGKGIQFLLSQVILVEKYDMFKTSVPYDIIYQFILKPVFVDYRFSVDGMFLLYDILKIGKLEKNAQYQQDDGKRPFCCTVKHYQYRKTYDVDCGPDKPPACAENIP